MTGDMVLWRARCGESRTSGSEGGPGRRASRKARTAPWSRPYCGALLWDSRSRCQKPITKEHFRSLQPGHPKRPSITPSSMHGWRALPNWERRVLGAVAAGGEVASLQSVREGVNFPNRRMQPLIAELETKGLLYRPERGTPRLHRSAVRRLPAAQ